MRFCEGTVKIKVQYEIFANLYFLVIQLLRFGILAH